MPFHHYISSRPEVLSGVFPGFLFDSSTRTTGVVFHRDGFNVLGEYETLDWEISPYRAWRFEGRYSGSLNPTLHTNLSVEYLNKYYPEGTSLENDFAYRERRTIFSGTILKELFNAQLKASAGGSYSRYHGLSEGRAFSLNSSLIWRIAKLDFTLGATAYQSEAEGNVGLQQKRTHQYYYFNVGRKLF
jgi:hypothetical protein